MKFVCDNPTEVAKEMFWLAFRACEHPLGNGWLNDKPEATREDVWNNVSGGKSDYAVTHATKTKPRGEYVFGRRVDLSLEIESDGIIFPDDHLIRELQTWIWDYPTYLELAIAAEDALEVRTKV